MLYSHSQFQIHTSKLRILEIKDKYKILNIKYKYVKIKYKYLNIKYKYSNINYKYLNIRLKNINTKYKLSNPKCKFLHLNHNKDSLHWIGIAVSVTLIDCIQNTKYKVSKYRQQSDEYIQACNTVLY